MFALIINFFKNFFSSSVVIMAEEERAPSESVLLEIEKYTHYLSEDIILTVLLKEQIKEKTKKLKIKEEGVEEIGSRRLENEEGWEKIKYKKLFTKEENLLAWMVLRNLHAKTSSKGDFVDALRAYSLELEMLLDGEEVQRVIRSGNPNWVPTSAEMQVEGFPPELYIFRAVQAGRCEGSGGRPSGSAWRVYVKRKV